MKLKILLLLSLIILNSPLLIAQDTFSIVAMDTITGEVGSAGASCVNLIPYPNMTDDFLGELFPGVGAINCQAYYLESNQINARNRMNEGLSPSEIIDWLVENDVQNQPQKRQYGIVAMVNGSPESAAHTGTSTDDYKNHITGPNYSIQGNILLGQVVLDSMEARFLREPGDLACKLMAALQGANMVGADSRCSSNGTSSLFAFVKVAQVEDEFGSPSFVQSVRTASNASIEPIDSLQILFDEVHYCPTVGIEEKHHDNRPFLLQPNPANDLLNIDVNNIQNYQVEILDLNGRVLHQDKITTHTQLDISHLKSGLYFVRLYNTQASYLQKFIKK
ncbi:MAG: DUF1028 domain-containing protein [Bacteroidales bacterium]|nr:DUF1028 domain-containing protein [Bacteroidales bacterium]